MINQNQETPVDRNTPLRDIGVLSRTQSPVVHRETDLADLDKVLAQSQVPHTIAVVDEDRRLVGIVPLALLAEQMFLRYMPMEFLSELRNASRMAELGQLSLARRAEDVMSEPVSVTVDSTLGEALKAMHINRLLSIPVVDDKQRVVGDADLIQLLHIYQVRHVHKDET